MEAIQPPAAAADERYRLHVIAVPPGVASLEILDLSAQRRLARWHGPVANSLLNCDALPLEYRSNGSHPCGKKLVSRLMLAAAAADLSTQNEGRQLVDLQRFRLNAHRPGRSSLHNWILRLLYSHPGYHFAEQDVVCLTMLEAPGVDAGTIVAHLRDIVSWRLAQRIEVDAANVFYDIDTTPHLHVFDARRRMLTDAPDSGCLKINSRGYRH